LQLAPGDSTIEDSTGEDPVDRKMTIPKGKTRYQFMSFIHEILFLFINSFLSFPSHIKRIILCFVYSDDNRPSFIYPSLEEENMPSSCVVDTDLVSSPLPIHKSEICIASPLEIDHPCSPEEVENNSQSSQISLPSVIPVEPCHQLVNPHDQPTAFQIKIRNKLFKPLRLPLDLHPYPLYSFEYLPRFSGEDHITAERHLGAFENFVDQFEIVHEDVTMRLFSHSLSGDVVVWFRCLEVGSIGSWTELCHAFLKCWGENKSLDQYWFEFNDLRRGEEEALVVFNRRFYSVYHSMPVEIRPTETVAMVYYVMAQHSELVLLLRERKSSSLRQLFEDAEEVEENIKASKGVRTQAMKNCIYMQKICMFQILSKKTVSMFQILSKKTVSMFQIPEQEDSEYNSDLEQQQGGGCDSHLETDPSIFADSMGRNAYPSYDQFLGHFEHVAVVDCIDNYTLLADHSYDVLNPVAPLSYDHSYEEETATVDDQELFSKEQGSLLFTSREAFTEEQPGLLKQPGFCHTIHDPMAIYMESYVSDFKNFQDLTIETFPLFIEEKHCVEISHLGPAEDIQEHDKEQSFPMVPVYDDYDSDPWESHEEEEGEPNV
jgi:hypothetical protein